MPGSIGPGGVLPALHRTSQDQPRSPLTTRHQPHLQMTALTSRRVSKNKTFSQIELPGTPQQIYQGGVACWDTSTGLVAKATASATMIPIGKFVESKIVGSGETVLIDLFRELRCEWLKNSAVNAVDAASLGSLVYLEDDQTVRKNDNGNTLSVAGRCWGLDARNGVLVEMRRAAGDRLGGLDA